jgi:hypothetical protein
MGDEMNMTSRQRILKRRGHAGGLTENLFTMLEIIERYR